MGVGDYVLDDSPPPPMLKKALNYEKWGIGDLMQLPAGMLPRINTALSYYYAISGYTNAAGRTVAWKRSNSRAWELVSYLLELRLERRNGNRN